MSMIKHARARRSSSRGRSQASLARSSAIMASGTLVSRILGMVRNALIVMALGATGSGAADALVGPCPSCGKDLQLKASHKPKSMVIGCAGWPDCDVTYPLPKGKIEAVPEKCPTCGMPQVKVTAFRSKPRTICIDPHCSTNQEPDVVVGECPACKEKGIQAKLIAQKNPRTLKRFIRCENYDDCGTGYPLPQYGALTATEEVCEHCGAPMVIVTTARGPWKLCPNFDCPGKEQKEDEKGAKGAKGTAAKKPAAKTGRKTSAKKETRPKKGTAGKEKPAE